MLDTNQSWSPSLSKSASAAPIPFSSSITPVVESVKEPSPSFMKT